MKKIVILLLFLVCLSINSYKAYTIEHCYSEIIPKNLNSKHVVNYLKEVNIATKMNKICSQNICETINPSNLERDIKNFVDKNIQYLKTKDEKSSLDAELKGFKITKIILNSCD